MQLQANSNGDFLWATAPRNADTDIQPTDTVTMVIGTRPETVLTAAVMLASYDPAASQGPQNEHPVLSFGAAYPAFRALAGTWPFYLALNGVRIPESDGTIAILQGIT